MYCFSQICRICLEDYKSNYIHLNAIDDDNIKIRDKLEFCIPEIISNISQLPENVCETCQLFLQKMYKFKNMCIDNTNILNDYIVKLSGDQTSAIHKLDLSVSLNKTMENEEASTIETDTNDETVGETKFSISLNQWDLFETKFTCRCVKDYSSIVEGTSHLCQNCEGDLHGFQLSKIKVGNAENRYNNLWKENKLDNEDSNQPVDIETANEATCEEGFSYNDLLLCKVHVNNVKKQIDVLKNVTDVKVEKPDTSAKNNDSSVRKNKITKTKREKIFICPICNNSYTTQYYLHVHYGQHEESIFYYCEFCQRKFVSQEELDKHQRTHFNKSESKKPKINNSISDDVLAIKSEFNISDDNLTCGTCDKSFSHKSNLAVHLLTHAGKQEYKCDECGEEFFRKENLISHRYSHMSPKKYQCNHCDKSYNHKSNLRRHERSHGGSYLCSICNETFSLKQVLIDHIYNVHTKVTSKYPCPYCDDLFSHKRELKTHVINTHKLKKIQQKTETSDINKVETSEIETHAVKKTYNTSKTYSCKVCYKKFSKIKNLQEHKRSHKLEKDLRVNDNGITEQFCSICERSYSINTNMKKHMAVHATGKIKTCNFCNKTFTNTFVLRTHMRVHADKFCYKCEMCSKSYLTKTNLIRHMEVSHK